MTFDGFDAAVLIEAMSALALPPVAEASEEPTLQDALAETGASARDAGGLAALRPLSRDDLLLIAGGNGSEFTVWGPDPWWDPSLPNDPNPDGPYGNNGGGGGNPSGQDSAHQQTEDANDTPCVDEVPQGVDLSHLNDLAKFSANQIGHLQDSTDWEWGVFIYIGTDGQLYQSDPFTGRHHDNLDDARIVLPDGVHIVAYIHSHPIDDSTDGRHLSAEDRGFINRIIQNGVGTVTVDANMLAYVATKDQVTGYFDQYRAYVYDKSKRNSDSPGCQL